MRKDWEPFWRESGGWQVDFSIEGHRFRRRLGIRDRSQKNLARDAAKRLYRAEWQRHLDPVEQKPGTPFFAACEGYVKGGGEARFLPPLMRHFGPDMMIEDIGEPEILEAGEVLYPGRAADTVRRQVRVPVGAVIRWARGERRRPRTDRPRTRWLTPEEAERLLEAAAQLTLPRHAEPERYTLQKIAFLLGSGCRTGECFAAEVKDWNAATRQWWIPGDEEGAGKTAGAARWVSLPARAVEMIGEMPEVGRAFRTPYGTPIKLRANGGGQMQTAFNKAREAAGLGRDVTPHVLRHTWATWFYAQTRDFGGLLDRGGWTKADTANRYRKIAPEDLAARLLAHGWDFRQGFGNPGGGLEIFERKQGATG
ncbi:tyrosine-type recombinase/integrase [Vannielia litorea]|uniref:tyrosine-type recombinase/integrase n=1 Tax=Vannielia litorea TaxID=1217970 RepID=UPI001BCC1DFA|nr:tyrosine-type recombinase/integrase [Vannielia litorea]